MFGEGELVRGLETHYDNIQFLQQERVIQSERAHAQFGTTVPEFEGPGAGAGGRDRDSSYRYSRRSSNS